MPNYLNYHQHLRDLDTFILDRYSSYTINLPIQTKVGCLYFYKSYKGGVLSTQLCLKIDNSKSKFNTDRLYLIMDGKTNGFTKQIAIDPDNILKKATRADLSITKQEIIQQTIFT